LGTATTLTHKKSAFGSIHLKWLMSRIVPKKWGDRLLVAGDEASPVHHLHKAAPLTDLTDTQLDALQRFTQSLLIDAKPD
jgi:hypothetical protein